MSRETSNKRLAVWHGTRGLALELRHVVRQHCTCATEPPPAAACASHDLLFDQRAIDGLLFGRWIAVRLMREEFSLHGSRAA
jgi:hypothetical protein